MCSIRKFACNCRQLSRPWNSLYESGNFGDCSIVCGSLKKSLHRFVLCQQSSFSKGALEGSFKVCIPRLLLEIHGRANNL